MSTDDAEHRLENVGSRETHRIDPDHLERLARPERLERIRYGELVEEMDLQDGETVVDFGCGSGLMLPKLADAVGDEGTVYGTEIAQQMLDAAQETLEEKGITNVTLVLNTEKEIPVPDDVADSLLLVFVLHEIAYPEEMLRELSRITRPGGALFILDWKGEETEGGPPLEHRVSEEEAISWFEEVGFTYRRSKDWDPALYLLVMEKSEES